LELSEPKEKSDERFRKTLESDVLLKGSVWGSADPLSKFFKQK
jgi:hypothetical protein